MSIPAVSGAPPEDDWFAKEEFWVASYDAMFPESRVAAAAEEVDQILTLTGITTGSVLDLACGPGRHSIALAQRGFSVTGVDRSPFLLGRARARAAERGVEVEWIETDMRAFRRPASFDLALNLFTSFGYFRDDAENERVLRNVAESLRPGGALVIDTIGKEVLARVFNPTAATEMGHGLIVQRRRVVDDWNRMDNEWLLIRDGRVELYHIRHWIYSARELKEMLHRAGFPEVGVFAGYDGAEYGPEAKRMVVVGRTR